MSYVYLQSERTLWTVGFYDPDGEWQAESDHSAVDLAAERVAYLNGGGDALELRGAIKQLKERVTMLEMGMNAAMRQAIAEARAVIEQLPVEDDPYMPTDAEWAAYPEAMAAATDIDGKLWLYRVKTLTKGTRAWSSSPANTVCCLKDVAPPANFHTTLRHRPAGI